uniref:ATP synthase F0 subunit 8 n=1 Tax=Allobates femoralis TaxID=92733 RepID=A0A7L9CV26_ALLFE|nr:ATP synthase F0 subunit 8 [Allobates femoralis]
MPQLVLQPWFHILFISWVIFLYFATVSMTKFIFLNNPSNLTFNLTNTSTTPTPMLTSTPWSWPWL